MVLWGIMHVMPSPTEERSASSLLQAAEDTPLPPTRSAAEALFGGADSAAAPVPAPLADSLAQALAQVAPLTSLPSDSVALTEPVEVAAEEAFSLPVYQRTEPDPTDAGTVAFAEERSSSSRFGTLFLFLGALGVFGSLFWMMRLKKMQAHTPEASHAMQELGSLALTQQQSIHLVAVGPEVLLIGQGPQGLHVLSRYPRESAPLKSLPETVVTASQAALPVENTLPRPRPAAHSATDFAAQLRRRAPHLFVQPRA